MSRRTEARFRSRRDVIATTRTVIVATLLLASACGSGAEPTSAASTTPATATPSGTETTTPQSMESIAPTVAAEQPAAFPVDTFAAIREDPVTADAAAAFQMALDEMAGDGGMSATVMTAEGTWSGTAGLADGARAVQVDDQFAIASITKSIVAAQVMQLVEAGEVSLDDLAADHLPPDLDVDTNGATIRQLLSHRSGLTDWDKFTLPTLATDRQHVWTLAELLDVAGDPGWPAGSHFEYSSVNYFLLGFVIEQVRGRPLAQVLRDGVLAIGGVERLVYQPDERPSEPMAMPAGESTDALEQGGGYLSSIAGVTSGGPAAAIASDAPSLGRWFRALCAGEVVSPISITEMANAAGGDDFGLGYGLGLFNVAGPYGPSVGHAGDDYGFASWAACLPEQGAVVVVLANQEIDDIRGMARPMVDALAAG